MLEKEIKQNTGEKRQMRSGGLFSTKEKRVVPGPRYATSGNVTMATDGATYRFPNPYGATQVLFNGLAVRYTANFKIDIRANISAVAQLRPSYYFEPQSLTSVAVAKAIQKIIQSGHYFLVTSKTKDVSSVTVAAPVASDTVSESRAQSNETVLTNILWPGTEVVARMEVMDYGHDWFDVKVNLAENWEIYGNFVCT